MGERCGRGKSRNMNRGPMDTDNGVGTDCGWGTGQRRAKGKMVGQL